MKKNTEFRIQNSAKIAHCFSLAALFCILTSVFWLLLLSGCGGGGGSTPATTNPGGSTTPTGATTVSITSNPANMSVYLNDTLYGTTPFFSDTVNPGTYTLKIAPPSGAEKIYSPEVISFTVVQGLSNTHTYSAQQSTGGAPTGNAGTL